MKRRSILRWSLLALTGGALVLGLLAWRFAWRSPPYYTDYGKIDLPAPILTAEQYTEVSDQHARPFIVQFETPQAGLLLYGASHTKDSSDPQISDLRQRWSQFRPTAALVEGRMGFLLEGFSDPVRTFGESGLVHGMARSQGVKCYTWEPPVETEVAQVLESHAKERVALFYILRPYFSNLRHGRPADPDSVVEEYRRKRTKWPGLQNTFASVAEIDTLWQRDFADMKDWRETSDEYGLPGYLKDVWTTSNAARDEHFARVIIDLVRNNERVFAVCGSSHAVKLEPALRAALEAETVDEKQAQSTLIGVWNQISPLERGPTETARFVFNTNGTFQFQRFVIDEGRAETPSMTGTWLRDGDVIQFTVVTTEKPSLMPKVSFDVRIVSHSDSELQLRDLRYDDETFKNGSLTFLERVQ